MNVTFALVLPRDVLSVPAVRKVCGTALADLGVSPDCRDDIQIAITEACTNVLRHAEDVAGEYEVTFEITESACDIRVVDRGQGFESTGLGRQEAHGEAEGGRGIHLMRSLMDDIQFVTKPHDGTTVHLQKELSCEEGSVLARLADCPT